MRFLICALKARWLPCNRHGSPRPATDSRSPRWLRPRARVSRCSSSSARNSAMSAASSGSSSPSSIELLAVMAIDLGLDGVGAGERGLLGHQRGDCAERKAGDVPHRLKRGRAHPALGHQRIEAVQMALFLRGHARDQLGFRAIAAKHGELAGIDPRRAIFAGLVDAQHRIACRRAGRLAASCSSARRASSVRSSDQRRAAQRQDRVPAGERDAEEAELHLVAADQRRMRDRFSSSAVVVARARSRCRS